MYLLIAGLDQSCDVWQGLCIALRIHYHERILCL